MIGETAETLEVASTQAPTIPLSAEDLTSALEAVRLIEGSQFRRDESDWLSANNPRLQIEIMELFALSIKKSGEPAGTATQFGALFGSYAVRKSVEQHGYDYSKIKANVEKNLTSLDLMRAPKVSHSDQARNEAYATIETAVAELLGKEATAELNKIASPLAKQAAVGIIFLQLVRL